MSKTREILRQEWKPGLSYRAIGLSVGSAMGAVWLAVKRATDAGLDRAPVEALDARLYAREPTTGRFPGHPP